MQIVPGAVRASARQLGGEGQHIRGIGPEISSVTVSPTASVFDLQLPAFSIPSAQHVTLRGDAVVKTAEQLTGLATSIEGQDADAAASLRV